MWLWGHCSLMISSPGSVLHGTKWLLWRPHKQSPAFHSKCGINKGFIKRGIKINQRWSRCRGRMWPTPHSFIHSFWKEGNVSKTEPPFVPRRKCSQVIGLALWNGPNSVWLSHTFVWGRKQIQFSKRSFLFRIWTKPRNKTIPSAVRHRPNPLELNYSYSTIRISITESQLWLFECQYESLKE
jgi:hypothetical protein